jgi:hypothetical protein
VYYEADLPKRRHPRPRLPRSSTMIVDMGEWGSTFIYVTAYCVADSTKSKCREKTTRFFKGERGKLCPM